MSELITMIFVGSSGVQSLFLYCPITKRMEKEL